VSRRRAILAGACTCGALAWAGLASADVPSAATGHAVPTAAAAPAGLAVGSDGTLWLTESATGAVASLTTAGAFTTITARIASGTTPTTIVPGAAGTLWFVESKLDAIGEVTIGSPSSASTVTEHFLPGDIDFAGGIALDAQANLFVTLTTHQVVELFPPAYSTINAVLYPNTGSLNSGAGSPGSIVLGPDGNLWFTVAIRQAGAGPPTFKYAIDQLNPARTGTITQYASPLAGALGNLLVGPDGNLWVGAAGSPGALLRITTAGVITPFTAPADANPLVLAVGPDGLLWMADAAASDGGLTSASTAGAFTSYPSILPASASITAIAKDPGGADALWMTDGSANDTVYRVPLAPPPSPAPPPPPAPAAPPPPPALTAVVAPASSVALAAATLTGTISEPAGSAATAASYHFDYGISTAYGASTATATATATATGIPVNAPLTGLAPYTTYHFRLVASDCLTPSCQTASADRSFTTGSTLQPVANLTVGATGTGGTVLVKLHGHHGFARLAVGELIPLGSTIDARHGTVLLQSAIGPGEVASGRFRGGDFVVTQPTGGTVTVLVLTGNYKKVCGAKPRAHAATAAIKKKKPAVSHKLVNQVFGNAHGQFTTRGHYATAADQGTGWRTADRCDGTQIAVSAGMVTVTDVVHHRTFVLTAGHHRLIRTH
jgi:streptogramin lyase